MYNKNMVLYKYLYNKVHIPLKGRQMKSLYNTIVNNNLFLPKEKIGVACSGGSDSMSLLHFLLKNKDKFGIAVCAINVNHNIRKNSADDSLFVKNFCKKNNIDYYEKSVDCLSLKDKYNISSLENVARMARYQFFDYLLQNGTVDKICLAHHMSDQAETILLNILRGSGIKGASGMSMISGKYIRPMLNTTKEEILDYIAKNDIDYVTDQTNFDTSYSRNFLRQLVLPLLKTRFVGVEKNLCAFGEKCYNDNTYLEDILPIEKIICKNDCIIIPNECFSLNSVILNRLIKKCFELLNAQVDIEKKHIMLVNDVMLNKKNRVLLPNNIACERQHNDIIIYHNYDVLKEYQFTIGKINFNDICTIDIIKDIPVIEKGILKFDIEKLPDGCAWRKRKNGDVIKKINGKTQKLKDFLIDRKIPKYIRDAIPVLAKDNNVFICGNIEISDTIKIDKNSKKVYKIFIDKNFKE